MNPEPRMLEVRKNVLKQNDVIARALRNRFRAQGTLAVSLVSSPGAGKTTFLEKTLTLLKPHFRVAALGWRSGHGERCTATGAQQVPVRQITTGTLCHLEAAMIEHALEDWNLGQLDILFVENVGNLVCPASYDLGEDLRMVLLSVTEGEDKPLKYPTIFNSADVAVITKIDLAAAVEFDERAANANIQAVRPGMQVFKVSAKTNEGMDDCLQFLADALTERSQKMTV